MEKGKLGQEPAYPTSDMYFSPYKIGMSKRFYAACAAMQGLLTKPNGMSTVQGTIMQSYEYADELLKQENQ